MWFRVYVQNVLLLNGKKNKTSETICFRWSTKHTFDTWCPKMLMTLVGGEKNNSFHAVKDITDIIWNPKISMFKGINPEYSCIRET